MPKYIILYGKFGRHEDKSGNPVRTGGELVVRRPGDILEMSIEDAEHRTDSVRLANDNEIAAYEQRKASGGAAPTPANQAAAGRPKPLGDKDGQRLAPPEPPAGKPATQPVPPAAKAQAPAPVVAAPATPALPAVVPAAPPAPAAKPKAEGKPKARTGGGKKNTATTK